MAKARAHRGAVALGDYRAGRAPALFADLRGVTFNSVWGIDFLTVRRV